MVRLVASREHSFLIAESAAEIKRFLRRQKMRPNGPAFRYIVPPPFMRLSCYRLGGDQHLSVSRLGLPRITWGQLALHLLVPRLPRPTYGRLA